MFSSASLPGLASCSYIFAPLRRRRLSAKIDSTRTVVGNPRNHANKKEPCKERWKTVDTSGTCVTWNDGRHWNPYVAKRSFFRGSVTMSRFLVRPACSAARRGSCSTSRGPKSDADVPLHAAVHDRHSARAGFAPAQLLSIDAHYGGVAEQSAYRRSPS